MVKNVHSEENLNINILKESFAHDLPIFDLERT